MCKQQEIVMVNGVRFNNNKSNNKSNSNMDNCNINPALLKQFVFAD